MRVKRAKPSNIARRCAKLRAGDTLVLEEGLYRHPLVLNGVRGTANHPIIIRAEEGAVFTSGMSLEKYGRIANLTAMRRQAAGYYPSVGQTADEAALAFIHCQHIVLRGLSFLRCWPTAVYLDECQHVTLDRLSFREGTIAIGANGLTTRDITVSNCDWKQDVSADNDMWNRIPWRLIHGSKKNTNGIAVDPKGDYRAWDGDFFRAWDVAGNIIIRNNRICDAFNGIHFFNRADRLAPGIDAIGLEFNNGRRASANVLIEGNSFTRIRDNVIEPEDYAWNWVIRHNTFADCYRPFSFELQRAGWFYVYGNYGWVNNPPSMLPEPGERTKCSHFKLGGDQENEGGIHVFFNSWYYRKGKGIFPKGALGKLRHHNNAIGFGDPANARMFGKTGKLHNVSTTTASAAEFSDNLETHFTREWSEEDYGIIFDGDIVEDLDFPQALRDRGFALGDRSRGCSPEFAHPEAARPDLSISEGSPAHGSSIAMTIILPDGVWFEIPEGLNVGAFQKSGAYEAIDDNFGFLPDATGVPITQQVREEQDDEEEDAGQKPSLLLF
ncbi:right-handed parallel beta-helix repeat-containing protein [Hoeflea poritis]|uniref:Right-handed parallel beta-helix repeat-containing protein n=1 Tax=Hoeflea poritis TaxID=2993659 RepID=A0ABT4VIN8_9HYPH|nr:right-handed parallel beta-helix repeat-containing protein [Hoeflea poritis]MDA4844565.1 right-handed parallel beta-helix repeat-containing protein [Hoeflea poritis]